MGRGKRSEWGVLLRQGSGAPKVNTPACRRITWRRSMSVWGSEDLLKGKECTKRAEAGRSGNKPLLTLFYGLEKRVLVISTYADEQIKVWDFPALVQYWFANYLQRKVQCTFHNAGYVVAHTETVSLAMRVIYRGNTGQIAGWGMVAAC